MKMANTLKSVLSPRLYGFVRSLFNPRPSTGLWPYFKYDLGRFEAYSGVSNKNVREALLSRVIISYHVIEKGLTMPNRRFLFGRKMILQLIHLVDEFESKFGHDEQVNHGSGVIRAYWEMHDVAGQNLASEDSAFWEEIKEFINRHKDVPVAYQAHMTKNEFYRHKNSLFPEFAWSRHTLRHYSSRDLTIDKLRQAIDLARTTPTACNRQHCRVYCVANKDTIGKVLSLQDGNRGFGHLANKLLVVVADLEDIPSLRERNDIYICGGMFLMNLCYALFYSEIAHCVLNWSRSPEEDLAVRKIIKIKPSETIIAILTCGETPEEFDVASSPRKDLDDYFFVVK